MQKAKIAKCPCKNNRLDRSTDVKWSRVAKAKFGTALEDAFKGEHALKCMKAKVSKANNSNSIDVATKMESTIDKITTANLVLSSNQTFNITKKDLEKKCDSDWIRLTNL